RSTTSAAALPERPEASAAAPEASARAAMHGPAAQALDNAAAPSSILTCTDQVAARRMSLPPPDIVDLQKYRRLGPGDGNVGAICAGVSPGVSITLRNSGMVTG